MKRNRGFISIDMNPLKLLLKLELLKVNSGICAQTICPYLIATTLCQIALSLVKSSFNRLLKSKTLGSILK